MASVMLDRSPLAPARFPDMPPVAGVRLAVARAGFKAWERSDLLLTVMEPGTSVAGLTTRSACPSPEVEWCRTHLPAGRARALSVCAGNSNAFTGAAGRSATQALCEAVAAQVGCTPAEVFPAATGVIGVPLPLARALAGAEAAMAKLRVGSDATWEHAAGAIATTDTFPKGASATCDLDGRTVTIAGIAKGSGMIAPDMATMLAFLFTDAAVEPTALQAMLVKAADESFHAITVDGDTSTSDTLLAFATGAAGGKALTAPHPAFQAALAAVCRDLALQVVRDGEGAQKLIEIRVSGAVSDASARRIGLSIANSPLVKTAIAGADANWGRVVMAVGKAGEPAERDLLSIRFGGVEVAAKGAVVPGYDEAPVAAHLKGREILIEVGLGLGQGQATVWTCDLTHGYISINADYRS
jgi:glutamate N-acetyltransferase/amino-acid N-acetyltransferase